MGFKGLKFMSCKAALVLVGQTEDARPIYRCAVHHEEYVYRNGIYEEQKAVSDL